MRRIPWKTAGVTAIAAAVAMLALGTTGCLEEVSNDADELVRQAARALQQTSVKGTVITTVRVPEGERQLSAEMHRGEGRFVIHYLSGPAQGTKVHRQRGIVWVEGRENDEERDRRRRRQADVGEAALEADLLRRNWSFTVVGTRQVGGRSTTVVRGTGPGGSLTMALDTTTHFPLHMSRKGPDDELISETTWTEVDFDVEPPPIVDPPERREDRRRRHVSVEEVRASVDFSVLEPTWIPAGWKLDRWYLVERPQHPMGSMVEARYSDGLRPLTVIQRGYVPRDPDRDSTEREGPREELRQEREQRRLEHEERPGRGDPPGPEGREPSPPRVTYDRQEVSEMGPRHMRGVGGDASRRRIDGTMVIVIGPISEQQRERILDGMQGPS